MLLHLWLQILFSFLSDLLSMQTVHGDPDLFGPWVSAQWAHSVIPPPQHSASMSAHVEFGITRDQGICLVSMQQKHDDDVLLQRMRKVKTWWTCRNILMMIWLLKVCCVQHSLKRSERQLQILTAITEISQSPLEGALVLRHSVIHF